MFDHKLINVSASGGKVYDMSRTSEEATEQEQCLFQYLQANRKTLTFPLGGGTVIILVAERTSVVLYTYKLTHHFTDPYRIHLLSVFRLWLWLLFKLASDCCVRLFRVEVPCERWKNVYYSITVIMSEIIPMSIKCNIKIHNSFHCV